MNAVRIANFEIDKSGGARVKPSREPVVARDVCAAGGLMTGSEHAAVTTRVCGARSARLNQTAKDFLLPRRKDVVSRRAYGEDLPKCHIRSATKVTVEAQGG